MVLKTPKIRPPDIDAKSVWTCGPIYVIYQGPGKGSTQGVFFMCFCSISVE